MVILKNSDCNMHSVELWIIIKKPGRKILTLGVVYRPPAGDVPTFVKSLDSTLQNILGKGNPNGKELFLVGDFNNQGMPMPFTKLYIYPTCNLDS